MARDTQVTWTIGTFDRRKSNPFPLENRHYVLDWDRIPGGLVDELLSTLRQQQRSTSCATPTSIGESVITLSNQIRCSNRAFLKYRPYFRQINSWQEDVDHRDITRFLNIPADPDYMEDEAGKQISMIDAIEFATGQKDPLIMGNVESVCRLGPSTILRQEQWSVEIANRFNLFFDVVDTLARSAWLRTPISLSFKGNKISDKDLIACTFPKTEQTLGAVPLLRQLYSSDDLFNLVCRDYCRFSGNRGKAFWIKDVRSRFNSVRDREPWLSPISGYTIRRILDAVLYGASLLHSNPDPQQQSDWRTLTASYGLPQTLMCAHSAFRDLYGCAALIQPVLIQDVEHWLAQHNLDKPDRIQFSALSTGIH